MKKLLDKWISISLIKRIIGGLALGIILGLLVPRASGIALFGSVFVGALKAIAPLLVFVLVISSLCHSGKSHGGVIKTVIILYMFSTILASVIAVFTSKLFPVTLTLTEGIEEMSSPGSIGDVFNSLLMNIVENPITSLTKANYVGILAWAVVIGIACRHAKESTKDMLVDISNGLSKVVTWIINFAPFGIMGLVFDTVSSNGMSVFKEYGKLSHKNLDDLQSGFRALQVSGEDQKEDPLDFVLWKPKKEGEPYWTSPWCDGRPGWHIECSVMSKKYLGDEIDIHAGGEDLIFPHHENEIAQSECCNDKIFARYWMHNAFLNIDNRKMSKSLGNFRTVREISEQYDLQVLRFFMLNAHYRSPLNFSADLMESSKNALERITEAAGRLKDRKEKASAVELTEAEKKLLAEAEGYVKKFEEAMEDDFNTADALAAVFELVKFANTNVTEEGSAAFAEGILEILVKLCDVLGLAAVKKEEILDKEIEDLIAERQEARKAKNFARADEIRDELLAKGIILKDTREGVKWKRA